MSYEGSDILFEFFFAPADSITWSSREFDFGLGLYSDAQGASQALLRIETGQAVDNDARLAVEVTGQSVLSTAFEIQAISIAALHLAVEGSGWTDNGLYLELFGPDVQCGSQLLLAVREEERFTN